MNGQMVGNRGFVSPMPMTEEDFENIVKLTKQKKGPDGSPAGFDCRPPCMRG